MNPEFWLSLAGVTMGGINLAFLLTLIYNHISHLSEAVTELRGMVLRHIEKHGREDG